MMSGEQRATVAAIRARHENLGQGINTADFLDVDTADLRDMLLRAHADRATLLQRVEEMRKAAAHVEHWREQTDTAGWERLKRLLAALTEDQ